MKQVRDTLRLSATDLANHIACRHLSSLDLAAARGERKPPAWQPPDVALLAQRGEDHEDAFLAHLAKQRLRIAHPVEGLDDAGGFERTLEAMRAGTDVIVQATLLEGRWFGRADVLRRVERPSALGPWSYEVWDTKLARETKGGSVLQICLYSDLLGTIQKAQPEFMHVVPPRDDFKPDTYRVGEYFAYYRLVRRRLEAAAASGAASGTATATGASATADLAATYPDPVPHCDVCRWWPTCDAQRRRDDHLSLVAGISRLQTRELQARAVPTLEALASVALPIPWKPKRGAAESYARVREQARLQREGRAAGRALYELLPIVPATGLERLPAPSGGDVFFDLEGDPFVEPAGREYLFGWAVEEGGKPRYECVWALDEAAERAAFERFIDLVMERRARHPDMHVYHFAPYEPAAVKRLMGRYATRESEVDRLLRGGVFVDLHAVVRQALRASVEEYSIKKLEALYGFTREADLKDAGVHMRIVQSALELQEPDAVDAKVRSVVEAYNRDDCVSTLRLDRFLEGIRAGLEAKGTPLARPPLEEGDPSEAVEDREQAARKVMLALLQGVPPDRAGRNEEQQARWLLAYMLEWHRREDKAAWWEFFRLREMTDEALLDEKAAISGLTYLGPGDLVKGKPTDRYRFPTQETSIRRGDELRLPLPLDRPVGDVAAMDLRAHTLDIHKRGGCAALHPVSVFSCETVPSGKLAESLLRLGGFVAEQGADAPGPRRAARDLLLGRPPRLARAAGEALQRPGETGSAAARRLIGRLGQGTLAIQGPPGTGKTWTGARMICDLVRAGKKVGVCATSHKVIRNLLDEVVRAAHHAAAEKEAPVEPRCAHKVNEKSEEPPLDVVEFTDNERARRALVTGEARVLGGTAWLWSREEYFEMVDVLFVDEAGQMSLANVLAIAQCADAVVLLGDPRQLEQPLQGTHPEGCDVSALEHLLQGKKTIAQDRGLFLEETFRLHPDICRLTSELFYENRLTPVGGLEKQAILGDGPIAGAGLWFLPVAHEGNQSASPEEVDAVATLVSRLLGGGAASGVGARWRKRDGSEHPLTLQDILVIAPYNAQVADLLERLPDGARVGTVDRFQGQEAPVVIYSMTTSSPADAPRGMEFLYSLNRFNVATSRARCACIVVGNPRLFEPECQTPRQMQLANACCRYLELARELKAPAQAPGPDPASPAPPSPGARRGGAERGADDGAQRRLF